MKRSIGLLLGISLLGLILGCGPAPQAEPTLQATPALPDIWSNPAAYVGQEVTVEGTLEAEGQGLDVRFFLRGPGEARLQVTPWAPLEVMHPPDSGGPRPKTMLDYIGQRFRLTGPIAKAGEDLLLQVRQAEELP